MSSYYHDTFMAKLMITRKKEDAEQRVVSSVEEKLMSTNHAMKKILRNENHYKIIELVKMSA